MRIDAEVQILADGWRSAARDPEEAARRAVTAAGEHAARAGAGGCEVSVVLTDDSHLRCLNREHRGKDRATNVLAFPVAPAAMPPEAGPLFLGDVVLAFETVRREAEAQNKPISNHMSHLIVHGALHLLGYDHGNERDAARMEAEETAILARLGIPDPWQTEPAKEAGTAPDG